MKGLLTNVIRNCLRDGEPMERVPGDFALQGASETAGAIPVPGAPKRFNWNGSAFIVTIWRCPKCGTLEFVDEK